MENNQLKPEKITKPIQLLGAWLVGLLTIDMTFLFAATKIDPVMWQSGALTVAAIVNVPIFLAALFLLQTKFRPELQEDSYYSTYLNNRTNKVVTVTKKDFQIEELEKKIRKMEVDRERNQEPTDSLELSALSDLSYGVNVNLRDVADIEMRLSDLGVSYVQEFGHNIKPPSDRKVAVAVHVPDDIRKRILEFSGKLGFEHFTTIEPWEEIEEDVLFGAYGETQGKITYKRDDHSQ